MSSKYRVEVSATNRAICQDSVCKAEKVKITKGELRMGVWVELPDSDRGGWKWRHWGCVSGLQMVNLRDAIERNGKLDFDYLDGYDEMEDHPDIQEKIRRCVTQGHIDAEDFKGDPEFNKPGCRGIRPLKRKKKADKDADAANTDNDNGPSSQPTPAKTSKKRGRKAAAADEDDEEVVEEEVKPKKKAKKETKAKKDQQPANASGDEVTAPAKPKRARKTVPKVEPDTEESDRPVEEEKSKKKRGRKLKDAAEPVAKKAAPKKAKVEPEAAAAPRQMPSRKTKKVVEPSHEAESDDEDELAAASSPVEKPKARRGRAKKA